MKELRKAINLFYNVLRTLFYIWITMKKTCSTGDESIRKLNAIVYYKIKDLEDELMYQRWKMKNVWHNAVVYHTIWEICISRNANLKLTF